MARTATNAAGEVVIFNDQTQSWDPARTAKNDVGDTVYYDGSAWQPLKSTAPSTNGASAGSAPGGRAQSPAPAALSSPLPAGAPPSHDYVEPLRMGARDIQSAAEHGIENMGQGVEQLFGSGGKDPLSPESMGGRLLGAARIPLGAMQFMTAPAAPLFAGTVDANERGLAQPIEHGASPYIGQENAHLLGQAAANVLTGVEGMALTPGAVTRPAPMRSLPYQPRGPMGASPMPEPPGPPKLNEPGVIDLQPHEYGPSAAASPSAASPTQSVSRPAPVQPPQGNPPISPGAPPVPPPIVPPSPSLAGAAPPGGPAGPAGPAGPGAAPPAGGPPMRAPNPPPTPHTPPPGVMQSMRDAAKTIEKIVSPTTVDANARLAESQIREQIGLGRRDTEIARAALDEFNGTVRTMDGTQRRDLIRYVEGRSAGAPLVNPQWQPLADTMRAAFKDRERKLAALPSTAQMSFVEDYFPHQWKDQRAAQAFISSWPTTGKTGKGGFVKGREIPTVEDGLAAGLIPQTLNPLEASMAYIANADRFIAINRVFDDARAAGHIKYRLPGHQLPGEVELHGRLGNKMGPGGIPMKAYAPDGWARVFNNFIDPGVTGPAGDVMNAALKASNFVTALELSLSGYHAVTMANEASINSFARAIGELRTGRPIKAVKAASEAVVPGLSAVRAAVKGHGIQQVYKGKRAGTPLQRQIADLIARAGGQAIKMDQAWLGSRQGNYITAFKRGALKEQLLNDWADAKARPVAGTVAGVTRHIARIMDTAMSWLFEHVVPKMKAGAFEENMAAWLQRNPNAPPEVTLQMARTLWDSMDNRFGEMVRDNIFWRNTLKQASQLSLRSYSWTFGAGREIAGGAWDAGKAPFTGKWTPRIDYTIALPIVYGVWAAIYQYLKTGQAPQDENDLLAPRTGGMDVSTGQPERVVPPGFMKDVFGWAQKGIVGELWNKMATLPRTGIELATNKDWRGLPIAPGSHMDDPNAPSWLKAYFDHVIENLGPFGVKQAIQGQPRGSNISTGETLMGLKPAGRQHTDPEGYRRMMRGIETKAWRGKLRADERQERRYKGPVE